LGITPDRIDKGKPGQNGSLERMHGDIAKEIERKIPGGIKANQIALDIWREEYNNIRPNEAINMLVPADLYTPSPRKYTGDVDEIEYPIGIEPRKVQKNGVIVVSGRHIMISSALKGYSVGLREETPGKYLVYFCDLLIGNLDVTVVS
jgi:hypothetical protein